MPTRTARAHIPGPPAIPLIGHPLEIARNSYGTQAEYVRRHGPVCKTNMLGLWRVTDGASPTS